MSTDGPLPRREGPLGGQLGTRSDKRGGHIRTAGSLPRANSAMRSMEGA
jgi:hypothetical protein